MRLLFACSAALLFAVGSLYAAEDVDVQLKNLVNEVRGGSQEALAPLQDLSAHRQAGETVLSLLGDRRTGMGIKLRLAEIVAAWPAGEARSMLADWLARHPHCNDDALQFFSSIHLLEARSLFWSMLSQIKGPLPAVRDPERIALAAKALGGFQDNPEVVVARVAELLDAANPHVMRACAAEALGGMRSVLALQSLLPHLNDEAIGDSVHCSLFQLTGQDFVNDPDKWQAWLTAQGANIPWKMLPRADYAEYLRLQKLLKPLEDDPAMNNAAFYGLEIHAKGALFILDVSGSMKTDGRISLLQAQMSHLLTALQNKSANLRYGILTFGANVDSCFSARGIAVNDERNHQQAVQFVDRIQAGGGTPMCEALNHAFTRMLPGGSIDAIYFLSDGDPSDGTPAAVLDLARRIHARFQTRIHTISIGEEPAQGFNHPSLLNQIANTCGGSFTVPK